MPSSILIQLLITLTAIMFMISPATQKYVRAGEGNHAWFVVTLTLWTASPQAVSVDIQKFVGEKKMLHGSMMQKV